MGVPSKALRYAVLLCIFSGCAITPRQSDSATDATNNSGDQIAISAIDVDSLDAAMAGEQSDAVAQSNLGVIESQELLSADETGLGLRIEKGQNFTRLAVNASSQPVFDVMTMNSPPRLVVDLIGQQTKGAQSLDVGNDRFVKSVRLGSHGNKARVVFDLTEYGANVEDVDQMIDSDGNQLMVTFKTRDSAPAQVAEVVETAPVVAALPEPVATEAVVETAPAMLALDALTIEKQGDAGLVKLGLNDSVAFELKQTAPSEYVLSLPGVEAAKRTTFPLVTPSGFPGVRSVRAVQEDSNTLVRMFVDAGTTLVAKPAGKNILITAKAVPATSASARAQLQYGDEEEGAKKDESAEAAKPADETARENPTGIESADGSKIYTGRLISLDLQDTDIDNALRIIAEVSNLNIIASDDVTGKVTLRLIDVPWDQALDVILKTNGLDQVTEGNVIRIAPVEKLRQEREALLEAKRAAENLEDLKVKYIRVSYARVADMREQVESVLSERGSVATDERTNQLIVKDIGKGHDSALELIRRLDLRTPQVLLETQIVEAQRNILRDLGFQWNFSYVASPETGNSTGLNFPNSYSLGGGTSDSGGNNQAVNFPAVLTDAAGSAVTAILDSADGSRSLTARLSALETEGKVRVVSRPQVATVNNKEAQIKSVETVRVRLPDSGLSVATGSGASASGGGSAAFEEIDVGIELTVTPQASPDYYVLLDIFARSSTFGSTVVDNIPSTLEREATSTILVKSGQTFALGGVYRINDTDQVQGVPFLKDIPFLGHLFRRSLTDKQDEELIFFITPHIVEGSFDPSLM